MLFSDQLNVIAKYVSEIKQEARLQPTADIVPEEHTATTCSSDPATSHADNPAAKATINTYLDQMFSNVPPIVRHLFDITYDDPTPTTAGPDHDIPIPVPEVQTSGQKFTPKQIRESPDYPLWRQSQFQQLDIR